MRLILLLLTISGLIALVYYLVFRPHEFEVKFKVKTVPGDVIETIRIWNRTLGKSQIVEVDSFRRVKQTIVLGERQYTYDWNFDAVNDSILKINVRISEPGRRILNKMLIPFTEQPIETDATDLMRKFHDIIMEHLEITRVKILGEAELDSSFCLCSSLETAQVEKANGMMKDFPPLTSFITHFGLKSAGRPSIRVTAWDHNAGTLKFDFCFPIEPLDTIPVVDEFSYQHFRKVPVLKAEYYGNYITSDRAWYELIQYAERNGYEIAGLPIEQFHNNPNLGIRESEWKADIYLPIKRKNP